MALVLSKNCFINTSFSFKSLKKPPVGCYVKSLIPYVKDDGFCIVILKKSMLSRKLYEAT